MASRNLYLTYKRDTSRLLYWVINTSNGIVRSKTSVEDHQPVTINTTGHSTVSEIVQMSKLIAKHIQPVPSAILGLFQSVIKARSATYDAFQQIVNEKPDPEIERSNSTHKHFIEALTEACNALGGGSFSSQAGSAAAEEELDEEFDKSIFQNQFSALGINGGGEDDGGETDGPSETESTPRAKVQRKNAKGKGKKGKRAKKSQKKLPPKASPEASLADVPIESYRIIEDSDGLVSEYLLAVYAVAREWSQLRSYTQNLWREVAYDGLNGAVAASLTNIAVGMVKRTSNAVFVDFPGHDSYETIMRTVTRGDPDRAQGQFDVGLYRRSADGHSMEKVKETPVDIKEQIWVNTYQDLIDFLDDFRKNRSGKPTKSMQAQIRDWDPNFDLQRATNDERLQWRRAYTINWLYDLVNVFSSIVVQRNTMKGEHHIYETVDWSPSGPWNMHRRLFGLNEFAGVITGLAMQKQNTDIRQKILPHHVFQLQCIIDSFAASRGWTVNILHGHVVGPPARKFRPRRDVDLFLDRDCQTNQGFCQAVHILKLVLDKDAESHQHPSRHQNYCDILEGVNLDFINWLGESKYMHGLNTILPSRFSQHNTNGLWEYSPLLCATGLVEGLVLTQRISMTMWDRMTEPTMAIHLHNMLVCKGYIKEPINLYVLLQDLLRESFFPDGVPESGFYDALVKRVQARNDPKALRERQAMLSNVSQMDVHQLGNVKMNFFFKTKSVLTMYYDADWVPERIPDSEINVPSALGMIRLRETKKVVDSATGKKRLDTTELVQRTKARGMSDADIMKMVSIVPDDEKELPDPENLAAMTGFFSQEEYKDYGLFPNSILSPYSQKKFKWLTGTNLLEFLRVDFFADVCGRRPFSSLNYPLITANFMMVFDRIEERLRESRHPLYVRVYEEAPPSMRRKRKSALIIAAMAEEDPGVLKICADAFQEMRMSIFGFIFWDDLRETESGLKARADLDPDEVSPHLCSVM
ncbi:hypothetical protein DM02DRAFT_684084 [Periconia macrospinosa]|uniref:DUF6604 domain-containing protein n=1 Tax=Periconia macrospinosa TaxID=97972 RepID=A0A2V1E5X7_9PLEO|nr:hypothetical protein DM02DRAFT_684084 [Periconia macrospinosa]